MNKNILLLLVLLSLGIVAFFLMKNDGDTSSSIDVSDRQFAVEDEASIGKIVVKKVGETPYVFERRGKDWYVNDNLVADYKIVTLLKGVTKMRVENLPPRNAHKYIFESIKESGLHVQIFNNRDKLLKSYKLGPNAQYDRCTYAVMDGKTQPYCMNVTGFGQIRSRFLQEVRLWKDVGLYKTPIENISSVKVEYEKDYTESFEIEYDNGFYSVTNLGARIKANNVNQNKVKAYLREFESLNGEGYDNTYAGRDSITALVPFAKITLTEKSGTAKTITLWPKTERHMPGINPSQVNEAGELEKYYIETSTGDFMVGQHLLLKTVLRPFDFFTS